MPSFYRLSLITALSLTVGSTNLLAEDKPADVPVPPPPAISENVDEEANIKADVTIRKGKDKVVEEYRINGDLYMVRVIPRVGKPYYIKYPEGSSGRVIRRELDDIKTPFWTLFEW